MSPLPTTCPSSRSLEDRLGKGVFHEGCHVFQHSHLCLLGCGEAPFRRGGRINLDRPDAASPFAWRGQMYMSVRSPWHSTFVVSSKYLLHVCFRLRCPLALFKAMEHGLDTASGFNCLRSVRWHGLCNASSLVLNRHAAPSCRILPPSARRPTCSALTFDACLHVHKGSLVTLGASCRAIFNDRLGRRCPKN